MWELDKNVDDFLVIANSLRAEGQISRADAVEYLINRIHILEKELSFREIPSIPKDTKY